MCISRKILLFFILLSSVLRVYAQPVAQFTANPLTGCAPLLVQFTSTSTGNSLSYFWEFGNGNTSTLANPQASYVNAGQYTVKLTVSNASGTNVKTIANYITVYPLPTVVFGAVKRIGCMPHSTFFTDSSTVAGSAIVGHAWDFGNGNISTLANPSNTYNLPGSFQVSLMVTDDKGCRNSLIKPNHVNVFAKPALKITAGSNFGCSLPFQTQFTAVDSPAGNNTYLWDFGNGNQSTQASPLATYSQNGSYTVSLTLVNQNQCSVSVQQPNFVRIQNVIPDFNISGTPDLCEPGNVFLLNQTNFDTLGISYEWWVNGVMYTNFKNASLKNLPAGIYTVVLKVKIGACIVSKGKTAFTIQPSSKSLFGADRRLFCKVPATVQFSDSSTNVVSRIWDFGDGQNSNATNPSHTYTATGNYQVSLITTSSNGCSDTLVYNPYIRIHPAFAIPVLSPKRGCRPLTVNFSVYDTNTPPFVTFFWTLGKPGITSNQRNTSYTYADTGKYFITLTATTAEGCVSVRTDTVYVGMPVTPDFIAIKREYCFEDQPVILQNTTTPILPGMDFYYGDEDSIRLSANASYIFFNDTGYHKVTLTANHYGCISYAEKANYIHISGPHARFEVQSNSCTKSRITFINKSLGGNKFLWNFGDGKTGTGLPMTHDYDSAGIYRIRLLVIDTLSGCSSYAEKDVVVDPGFIPSFSFTPKLGCMPVFAILTNTSTPMGDVKSCVFNIGGNNYAGNQVFPLLYNPGKYTITMTITDIRNCVSVITKVDSILVNGANIKFSFTPGFGCAPLLMQVRDSSVADLPIVKRIWSWGTGDSTVYTHKDSVYSRYYYLNPPAYQPNGYTLKLILEDSMGCRFFESRRIYISKPKPEFTVKQIKTCGIDSFIFTPIADDLVGLSPSYVWKFNGQTYSGRIFKTVFAGNAILPVVLKAFDIYGCSDSIVKNLHFITGPPQVNFDADPKRINCPGPPILFFDLSTPGSSPIVKWDWKFGDGGQSDLQNPSRIYLLPGSYSVELTITDSLGCTDNKSIPDMLVIGGPGGSYSISPLQGCAPLEVNFSSLGLNVLRYEWDMGDGTIDTLPQTKHVYTRAGRYIPTLTLIDSVGCKIGLPPVDTIDVIPNPLVDFAVSKKKNCLGSSVSLTSGISHTRPILTWLWNIDGITYNTIGPIQYNCTHTGNIPVSFVVSDDIGCVGIKTDTLAIQVFQDTIAPQAPWAYRASVVNDEEVSFFFPPSVEQDVDHYLLQHDFVGSIPQQQRTIVVHADTLQYFTGLQTLYKNYSYQLQAVDVCNNTSSAGNLHTTIELKASGKVNSVDLIWTPYIGWDSVQFYEVFRLNEKNKIFEKIGKVSGKELTYTDTLAYCHILSRYQVKGIFNTIESWSDTAAAIPLFEPTTPQTRAVRATVENNRYILVQWWKRKHTYPFSYLIEKTSTDPFHRNEIIKVNSSDTFFKDDQVNVQQYAYAYKVYMEDACGGLGAPSNLAQSMVLRVDVEKNDKLTENPIINWNPYQEWASGVERYDVFFYNDSLGSKERIGVRTPGNPLSITHDYIHYDQDDYCYEVVAYQQDSSWIESVSNRACMSTLPRMYAPNAFTCNRDLLNDGFLIQGVFVKKFNMKIFDRWGTLLYETNDMDAAWDGNYKGEPSPSGVYVYLATGYGRKGQFASISGNVTLLR